MLKNTKYIIIVILMLVIFLLFLVYYAKYNFYLNKYEYYQLEGKVLMCENIIIYENIKEYNMNKISNIYLKECFLPQACRQQYNKRDAVNKLIERHAYYANNNFNIDNVLTFPLTSYIAVVRIKISNKNNEFISNPRIWIKHKGKWYFSGLIFDVETKNKEMIEKANNIYNSICR